MESSGLRSHAGGFVKGFQETKLYSSKYREDSLRKERKENKEGKLAKGEYICTRIQTLKQTLGLFIA